MDQPRAELLAGAALALDQDGNVAAGHHLQLAADAFHLLGAAEEDFNGWEIGNVLPLRKTYSCHRHPARFPRSLPWLQAICQPRSGQNVAWVLKSKHVSYQTLR